jgi:hypothetical protein
VWLWLSEHESLKESIVEIFQIVRACLGSFWFWLPVGFAVLVYAQILMFFLINPLTILIVPAILSVYVIRQEKRRLHGRYGLTKDKEILASDPVGLAAHARSTQWDATKAVEEYQAWLAEMRDKKEA